MSYNKEDKVRAALESRSQRKAAVQKTDASSAAKSKEDKVMAALASRSRRSRISDTGTVPSSYRRTISDLEKRYNNAVDSYTGTTARYNDYENVKAEQQSYRDELEALRTDINKYKQFFEKDRLEELLGGLDQMSQGYDSYLSMAYYANEDAWNKAVEDAQAFQKRNDDILNASDFEELSKYNSTVTTKNILGMDLTTGRDDTYEYINDQNGMRNLIKAGTKATGAGGINYNAYYKNKTLEEMTPEQVSIYNYIYAKEGKEASEEYLARIQEELNRKRGGIVAKEINAINSNFLRDIAKGTFALGAGAEQSIRNTEQFFNSEKLPTTSTEFANADIYETAGGFNRYLYSSANTIGNMAPSILAATLTQALGGPGQVVGGVATGISAAGSAYASALEKGYDKGKARVYSTLVGAAEGGLEALLGGIGKLGGSLTGKLMSKIDLIDNTLLRLSAKVGVDFLGEVGEEELQNFLEPALKMIIFGEEYDAPTIEELLETAIVTAITTPVMGSGDIFTQAKDSAEYRSKYGAKQAEIVNKALEVNPESKYAQRMKGKADNSQNLSGHTLNQLMTESDTTVIQKATEQRLREVGATENVEAIAAALTKKATGEGLTLREKSLIKDYDFVAEEMNPENIRKGKFNADWVKNIGTQKINRAEYNIQEAQNEPVNAEAPKNVTAPKAETEADTESPAVAEDNVTRQVSTGKVVTPKEEAKEPEIAEDGVTRQISTGKTVTPKKIVSIENGKAVVETDGGKISSEDIAYGDGDTATLWNSPMKLRGIDVMSANGIIKAYDGSIPVAQYMMGAAQEFRNGYNNLPSGGEMAAKLDQKTREIIYDIGQKAAGRAVAKAQAKATEEKRAGKQSKKEGKVVFDRKGRSFSNVRETALKTMEQLSRVLGVEFHVYESYEKDGRLVFVNDNGQEVDAPNGFYEDGKIYIDLNAGNDGKGTMLFTVAHELTHFIKDWSPAKFKILANLLIENYTAKGQSAQELIDAQIAKAERSGRTIDEDEAFEEVVADSMEAILTDGNVVEFMAAVKQQDQNLWEKIRQWFRDLAEDLRKLVDAYKGVKPASREGRMVSQMQDVIMELEAAYAQALDEAGENFRAAEENTTGEGGVKYSFAGTNAKTADMNLLDKAKQMEEQGLDNEQIRKETGWFRGMDGKWRFEIDDSQMEIAKEISNYMRLGELMQHPSLYVSYPDLVDIPVVFHSLGKGVNGAYNPQFDSIDFSYSLKNDPVGLKDALAHELQHAIQHREGFTTGATAEGWERKIKAGFDARRAEDIRVARETEQELRRLQEEEPEFYRDMLELYAMAPDMPRGEVDWDTLEKIEDDPVEWQRYDAQREELEAKYGDTKVWDMNDLLYKRQKAAQNTDRSSVELYFDTAGEIEARNVAGRRNLTSEQRKNTSPSLGNEDTVFADGTGASADYVGKTADGVEVYETSEKTKNLTWAERKKAFLHLMRQQYRGRTAKFIRNGHAYYAKFGYRDVSKNIYGDDKSDPKGRDAKINVGADGDIFELVENSKYSRSETERGKQQRMHRGVKHWDYFVKTVQIDGTVFDLTANVRKKTDGEFVYIIEMVENNEIEPSSPQDSQNSGRNRVPNSSTVSINRKTPDVKGESVKKKFSLRDSSETDAAYISAVENGDMNTAQRMVDAAADDAGFTTKGYHGSRTPGFTVVDKYSWLWTARDEAVANGYGTHDEVDSIGRPFNNKGVYAMRYNLGNNLEVYADGASWGELPVTEDEYPGVYADEETGFITTNAMAEWAERNGYDSITFVDVDDGGLTTVDVIFNPNRDAKSADPITYDDNGNVIPLSKRFDPKNNDIRYSARDPEAQEVNRALEKENAKLKEDVERLKELVQLQKQVTGGTKFTKTSLEAAARQMKKDTNAKGDTKELQKLLEDVYSHIAGEKELTWESVKEAAAPAVEWLKKHVQRDSETSGYAKDVLKDIRNIRIVLDDSQRREVASTFGSYNDYRKRLMGSVTLANEGISLDSQWREWSKEYPNIFDPNLSASDMPNALAEAIDRLRGMTEDGGYLYDEEFLEQELLRSVYDSYWKVSTLYTVADRYQKKIDKLKFEHSGKMTELRQEAREKLENLRQAHRAEVDRIRKAARDKQEEQIRQIQEQNQASRKKTVDSRRRTEARKNIRKTIMELKKILNHGNKKRNVKEGMQDFVETAIASAEVMFLDDYSEEAMIRNGVEVEVTAEENRLIDETQSLMRQRDDLFNTDRMAAEGAADVSTGDTSDLDARTEAAAKLDRQIAKNMRQLKGVFERERNRIHKATVTGMLDNLAEAYRELGKSDDLYIRGAVDENVYQKLKNLGDDMKGKLLRDLDLEQLDKLHDAYKMVLHSVRNANKLFAQEKAENAQMVAEEVARDFASRKIPEKERKTFVQKLFNKIGWDYEKLYYALDRINSPAFTRLIQAVADSENITMQDVMEAKAFRNQMAEKYGYNNWSMNRKMDREFLDSTGKKFKLTLGEMMSLYAYSRREGAWDHIEYGGFVFGKTALTDPRPADSYKLDKEGVKAITDLLTPEQKAYAEEMQKYLSETMGAKGNEVTMKLYGIKIFKEKNYFPIHIAGQFSQKAQESQAKQASGFGRMADAGFTKAQNPNAKAPFVLEGFTDVWADHVNEMSRYHGAVPALEDLRRVMNRATYSDNTTDSTSVKQVMENHFGIEAVKYFDNLYREANSGATRDKLESGFKKMVSLFRKNSVAYSLSVLVQQPMSIYRAYGMIDGRYFGKNGFGSIASGLARTAGNRWTGKQTKLYEEMLKYAPGVTMAKEIGGFDTAKGGSIRRYLMEDEKTIKQAWQTGTGMEKYSAAMGIVDDNFVANIPNAADKLAWIEIWQAVKRETASRNQNLSTASEEFMQIVGKRFTEVIRATQVYDSIFAKSPLLKSQSGMVQMIVSFMNEPNTVANMAESAVRDFQRGDKRSGFRKACALVQSIIMTGVAKSIIYAMRDDDEDETFVEKYTESFVGSLLSDFNPFSYIPIGRDAWSVTEGYKVERADMEIIADVLDAIGGLTINLYKVKDKPEMTDAEILELDKKITKSSWRLAETLLALVGIPAKNMVREAVAILNLAETKWKEIGKTTKMSAWDKIYDAVIDSIPFGINDKSKYDRLYAATVGGDKEYQRRLEGSYGSETEKNSAIRRALRDNDPRIREAALAMNAGNDKQHDTIYKAIVAEKHFSSENISKAIEAEADMLIVRDFENAYPNGSDISASAARKYNSLCKPLNISEEVYYNTWKKKGSLSGEVKEQMLDYIDDLNLSRKQKDALYLAFGWSENTIKDTPWH